MKSKWKFNRGKTTCETCTRENLMDSRKLSRIREKNWKSPSRNWKIWPVRWRSLPAKRIEWKKNFTRKIISVKTWSKICKSICKHSRKTWRRLKHCIIGNFLRKWKNLQRRKMNWGKTVRMKRQIYKRKSKFLRESWKKSKKHQNALLLPPVRAF